MAIEKELPCFEDFDLESRADFLTMISSANGIYSDSGEICAVFFERHMPKEAAQKR